MTKIRYTKNSSFDNELRSEIKTHLLNKKESILEKLKLKEFTMLTCWICLLIFLNLGNYSVIQMYIYFVLLGIFNVLIFLNIIHDAGHNALSKSKRVNYYGLELLNLIGACSFIWKYRHVVSHHLYTNIPSKDLDIKQSGIVRIVPNGKFVKLNRFQHYYMPILYFGYTLYWLLIRDFTDILTPANLNKPNYSSIEIIKFIVGKLLYLGLYVLIPFYSSNLSFLTITVGFLVMHLVQGGIASLALLTAHVSEESYFPIPDKDGIIKHSWFEHQIITTSDFGTKNKAINFLFGGFNFHVAHHLFPTLPNRYYEKITPIIEKISAKHNLDYKNEPLGKALISHWKLLKNNSRNK